MKQLVPQKWFALFECTLVLQQWFALFGYFVAMGEFALFLGEGGGVTIYQPKVDNTWQKGSTHFA